MYGSPSNFPFAPRTKIDMLDNLLEIEVAYNLLQTTDEGGDKEKDAFDAHYDKLKTDITVSFTLHCFVDRLRLSN